MKPLAQQNFYEILDIPFDASAATIAEAMERALALYAPGSLATYTLMDPEEEHLLVRLLEEARATLLDPVARARYDERITGPEAVPPPAPAPSPVLDAALRAAWPELPPVIPAAVPASEDEGEEEDEERERWQPAPAAPPRPAPPIIPAAAQMPVPGPPVSPSVVPPGAGLPVPGARTPILLNREVAAPAATDRPATTPAPIPSAVPVAPPAPVEGTTWSGEVLRQIREARGISLQQVSERTKVTRHHIENIEADRFELLPAAVYLRGILLSIARELRLDGQKVARSYLERFTAASSPPPPVPRPK